QPRLEVRPGHGRQSLAAGKRDRLSADPAERRTVHRALTYDGPRSHRQRPDPDHHANLQPSWRALAREPPDDGGRPVLVSTDHSDPATRRPLPVHCAGGERDGGPETSASI